MRGLFVFGRLNTLGRVMPDSVAIKTIICARSMRTDESITPAGGIISDVTLSPIAHSRAMIDIVLRMIQLTVNVTCK